MSQIVLAHDIALDAPYRVVYADSDDDDQLLVLVTVRIVRPPWIDSSILDFPQYDLHLAFVNREKNLLFLYSATDSTYRQLLKALGGEMLSLVAPAAINAILSAHKIDEYFSVGLRSSRATGLRQPSYKMMAGRRVQGSVTPSDGRGFVLGPAIANSADDGVSESIGVSVAKSKVWSVRSGSLLDFRDWCVAISEAIANGGNNIGVPMMPLRVPEPLTEFPDHPIGFVWDARSFARGACLEIGGDAYPLSELDVDVLRISPDQCTLAFVAPDGQTLGKVLYSVAQQFTALDDIVTVRSSSHSFEPTPVHDFLSEYTPTIFFSDGSAAMGRQLARVPQTVNPITNGMRWDWTGTDITNEATPTGVGAPENIQDTVIRRRVAADKALIVVRDHGTHELADVICIGEGPDGVVEVELLHCKGSSEANPGARVDDYYEVCGQAVRSIRWAQGATFLPRLIQRLDEIASTTVVSAHGQAPTLTYLRAIVDAGARVKFRVTVVQPGGDMQKVATSQNTNILLHGCTEWLLSQDIELLVLGS